MAITETLKALSDPIRRKILDMLKDKQLNAGEIAAGFDLTDATISHHLSVLKNAGLIDSARKGTFIIYSLNTSLFEEVMSWMMTLKGDREP
ncbi:MAG: autorepressor SdpR family transcription factor [Peptococcaceae bacterium]|nr:autorepressor SdpR family transcription factor [Peptococcaceae bacterium]